MSHEVTLKLLVILSCFAVLTFAGSRKWLRPTETIIVGIAMIFWASAWLLETLLRLTVALYGDKARAILIAVAMTLPMTLSMSAGLWFLVRRMRKNPPPAPSSPNPLSQKKKKPRG